MTILYAAPVFPREVTFPPNISGQSLPKKRSTKLYFGQPNAHEDTQLHVTQMLFPLPSVKENFSELLDMWFEQDKHLRSVNDLFLGTFYDDRMHQSSKYLNLVQALESYHRMTHEGKYILKSDYQNYLKMIDPLLAPIVPAILKESLRTKLKYANEYMLKDRLDEIFDEIGIDLESLITKERAKYIRKIIDTRNSLVHNLSALRNRSFAGLDLSVAIEKIRYLLLILSLRDLGIQDQAIFDSIRNNGNYLRTAYKEMKYSAK